MQAKTCKQHTMKKQWNKSKSIFMKNVGMTVLRNKADKGKDMALETRCSIKQRKMIMASNNNNIHCPIIKRCRVIIVECHYPPPLFNTAPCFSCHISLPLSALFL